MGCGDGLVVAVSVRYPAACCAAGASRRPVPEKGRSVDKPDQAFMARPPVEGGPCKPARVVLRAGGA